MRTRVRVIFSLWLSIAAAAVMALVVYWVPPDLSIYPAFVIWLLFTIAFIAIWRTQPTFRRLMRWASGGLWPRNP